MYLLFECGICSSLYQVQVEKFSNSLQKVVCPSCQSFHYFGAAQDISNAQTPTIENVFNQKAPKADPKVEQRTIDQELFWRCGVCESGFHFNLNRVTAQGIKVTCTTCFSFFVLQKVSAMVDLDHMVMHEVSPDKVLPTNIPPEQLHVNPPEIDEKEVSGKFNLNTIKEELAKISTNEIVPPVLDTPKMTPFEKFESSKPKMPPPPPFPKESSQPKVPPKTNPYVQTSTSSRISTTQPAVKLPDKPIEMKANDTAWVNSFKSFNNQRREFKMPQLETTSVTFTEHNPKREKNFLEKNMVNISMWIAGICAFALVIVFTYDWYERRQEASKPAPIQEVKPDPTPQDPTKPQYGFPELGE